MSMAPEDLMCEDHNKDDELLQAVEELNWELVVELIEARKGFIHGLLVCFCGAFFMVPVPDFVKRSKQEARMEIPIIFYSLAFIVCFLAGLSCIFQYIKLRIHHIKKLNNTIALMAAIAEVEEDEEVKEYKAIKMRVEELKAEHHRYMEYFEAFRGLVSFLSLGLLTWLAGSFLAVLLLEEDDMAGVFTTTGYVMAGAFIITGYVLG